MMVLKVNYHSGAVLFRYFRNEDLFVGLNELNCLRFVDWI